MSHKMTDEQDIPTESCEGTTDTFASVWVKVEMNDDCEVETEKTEINPDSQNLQLLIKPEKKRSTPRTPTVLKCEHCPYTSIYKNCFKLHVMDHVNSKPFSCDACSYTTKYPTSLQRHMFIKHQVIGEDNKLLLYCDACDYSTHFKWNLKSHKRRHATNKLFQCEHCTYSTAYRHNFVKHSRVHNKVVSEYKCDKCPFVTRFTGHIQRHMSQIHNEVSEKASACDFCDFTTMVRWRLNVHKQRSKQENPLKCGRCGFQTFYMCESKKHKKSHFNELYKARADSGVNKGLVNEANELRNSAAVGKAEVFNIEMVNGEYGERDTKRRNYDEKEFNEKMEGFSKDEPVNVEKDLYENKEQLITNPYNSDGTSQGFLKDMVKVVNNENSGLMNVVGEPNTNRITKGFSKGEPVNFYDYVQGVSQNMGQISEENEYDSVRISEAYLKGDGVNLYDFVNGVNENHRQISNTIQKENDMNFDETTTFTNTTKTSNSTLKMTKVKNYLVDPKCETRKTIQVLESEDTERPFQCFRCTYTSKFKAAVIRHYQRLHTSENKPFKCCNCDFSTKTKDQISLHNKRSQSEGTLICNICNFTTNFKCSYVMHQKVHYAHKCAICDYSCRNKYDIQKHFATVHLGEGMKCRFCEYKSGRRESLLCHEAVHTGHKPFKCELCEYQSVRRSLLEVHFRRCHGEAKFVDGKVQLPVVKSKLKNIGKRPL